MNVTGLDELRFPKLACFPANRTVDIVAVTSHQPAPYVHFPAFPCRERKWWCSAKFQGRDFAFSINFRTAHSLIQSDKMHVMLCLKKKYISGYFLLSYASYAPFFFFFCFSHPPLLDNYLICSELHLLYLDPLLFLLFLW